MSAGSKRVVLFGGSHYEPGEQPWQWAEQLGALIGQAGWDLVSGGYGGIMEAASSAASPFDGDVVGVLCKAFGVEGNAFVKHRIVAEDAYQRLQLLASSGDAFIVLPGSTGTLVELAMVWELVNKRLIDPKPIVCLGDFWEPVISMFRGDSSHDARLKGSPPSENKGELIHVASSPVEAIDYLKKHWEKL